MTHYDKVVREVENQMYAEGYERGTPQPHGFVDGIQIDREVCAKTRCDACGVQGTDYHPFVAIGRSSYRAWAICRGCGHAIEF